MFQKWWKPKPGRSTGVRAAQSARVHIFPLAFISCGWKLVLDCGLFVEPLLLLLSRFFTQWPSTSTLCYRTFRGPSHLHTWIIYLPVSLAGQLSQRKIPAQRGIPPWIIRFLPRLFYWEFFCLRLPSAGTDGDWQSRPSRTWRTVPWGKRNASPSSFRKRKRLDFGRVIDLISGILRKKALQLYSDLEKEF